VFRAAEVVSAAHENEFIQVDQRKLEGMIYSQFINEINKIARESPVYS
jgi:hypothetical protein